jgi:hypothetical protein
MKTLANGRGSWLGWFHAKPGWSVRCGRTLAVAILLPTLGAHAAESVVQQAYIKASNTSGADEFGFSVAVSGDTMVVGADLESSMASGVNGDQSNHDSPYSGAAYVFVRSGTNLSQQAYLKASNNDGTPDRFGTAVAISGDTIVVGAWGEDSSATGVNGDQSNNTVLNSGAAYVFVRNGTNWSQQAYLKASNPYYYDEFGWSVAVSGDTIVVGAWAEDSSATGVNGDQGNDDAFDSGAAYVFVRSGTNWSQQAYLKASNTESGAYSQDHFGWSVAVSSNTVVIGANMEDSNTNVVNGDQNDNSAPDAGAAYVFVQSGTNWTQQAYLKAANAGAFDAFGDSVAISGDTVVVGATGEASVNADPVNNSAYLSGAAYVFVRTGTNWATQAYLKASNPQAGDLFGCSVSVSGDRLVVGANAEDSNATGLNGIQTDNSASESGASYLFKRDGTAWTQQAYLKASNTELGDKFGYSVSVSGDTAVIGALLEDSNATGINGNGTNNLVPDSGAAYVFSVLPPPRPLLSVLLTSTNTVAVSWPSPSTGFSLQVNTNLITTSWLAPSESLFDDGTNKYIIVNPPTGARFYRLKNP